MQVEDFLEKKTREERLGPRVEKLPDDDLFFVDKAPHDTALTARSKRVTRKELARSKLSRAQAIIQASSKAEPVAAQSLTKKKTASRTMKSNALIVPERATRTQALEVVKEGEYDIFAKDTSDFKLRNKSIIEIQKRKKALRKVPAVEVDSAGCSLNPEHDAHQDALASAVAAEMRKEYDKDLLPVAPPLTVEWEDYEHRDELERLLIDNDMSLQGRKRATVMRMPTKMANT